MTEDIAGAARPDAAPRRPTLFVRALHLWFRLSRGLTLGVRGAVFDAEGRIFLIRHTYAPGWQLPGGGVETGETALDALARELREEGNLVLTGPPRLRSIVFNGHVSKRDHVLLYEIRAFRQTEPKRPDREIAESGFFAPDALPEGVTAGTQARLAEIASDGPFAPRW